MSKNVSSGYVYGGANAGKWGPNVPQEPDVVVPPSTSPVNASTMTASELAKTKGFTGDICSNCGGMNMQMAGHCQVCSDCGTTTGCS